MERVHIRTIKILIKLSYDHRLTELGLTLTSLKVRKVKGLLIQMFKLMKS